MDFIIKFGLIFILLNSIVDLVRSFKEYKSFKEKNNDSENDSSIT